MSNTIRISLVFMAACFSLTACTETIIREVPSGSDTTSSQTTVAGTNNPTATGNNNMVVPTQSPTTSPAVTVTDNMVIAPAGTITTTPAQQTDVTASEESGEGNGTDNSASAAEPGIQLQDPTSQATQGDPGMSVNCEQTLPCRWISADTQLSITITNADNIGTLDRLSVNYTVSTVHDTEVVVSRVDDAVDDAGLRYTLGDQVLGGGNGALPQGVVAGGSVDGTVNFDKGTTRSMIAQWSVSLLDGGLIRTANFIDIPVGTLTQSYADCENSLPCVWASPQNDVAITLQAVGGFSTGSSLSANFTVQTASNMTVALDAGATATGIDGKTFRGRTHTLSTENGFAKITATTAANTFIAGSVNFFRTESVSESLQELMLVLYPDAPVPRWNPRFQNVPVQ